MSHTFNYIFPGVVRWLKEANARSVLDLGCGNGAFANELAKAGFEVTGIDASESGIAFASKSYRTVQFLHADLRNPLPEGFRRSYDAVLAIEVIEHLLQPRVLFERAHEALRARGLFIVSTPYHGYLKNLALALTNHFDAHWHPLRDFGHVKFFSEATIRQLFDEQQFSVGGFKRVGRIPPFAKSMILKGVRA